MRIFSVNKNKKNKLLSSIKKKTSVVEWVFIVLVICLLGYLVFSLISQIYTLKLELKNLISLVQSLQESQMNLKTQLSIKDQEIELLENSLSSINLSSLSPLNEDRNLELLKQEIIKNNNKMSQFFLKGSVVLFSALFVFKLAKKFL